MVSAFFCASVIVAVGSMRSYFSKFPQFRSMQSMKASQPAGQINREVIDLVDYVCDIDIVSISSDFVERVNNCEGKMFDKQSAF